jgi:MFS transporter, DHA2 family, multidrug resistance protein
VSAATRTWIGFAAMCVAMFMAILDVQVVASALVAMGSALHIGNDQLSWLQNAYLTAEIVAIPLTGWLTRTFGLRNLFAAATLGFTLASLGCALSDGFTALITLRIVQGFFGGMLIPSVFSAVFMLMPEKDRIRATTVAGIAAMLAPTLGPLIGGYLAERFSWHWIFLINILPGLASAAVVVLAIPHEKADWRELHHLDWIAIVLASLSLACFELLLKEGPPNHWWGPEVASFAAVTLIAGTIAVRRCLSRERPFVNLRDFADPRFSIGSLFNFVLGMGLYGSVYLLALFLGLVRGHTPFETGEIMIVAGGVQLLTAAVAAWAETRFDARLLTSLGFGLFGAGLILNAFSTVYTDFAGLFWPQVLRGAAVMFCLLPATRLALDHQPQEGVADASGLFNLLRNVGGAIGIAGVDTILQERAPEHVAAIAKRLMAGDPDMARFVGLPTTGFHNVPMAPVDPVTQAIVEPLVRNAALSLAFNEAWFVLGVLFILSLVLIPFIREPKPASLPDTAR